jgi:GMP synthase (glutamine-hydrolysing)
MTVRRKPIAVINAGPITPELGVFYEACGGDNDTLFARACGLARTDVISIEVQRGEPPPPPETVSGVIVSGSASMVTAMEPWAKRCAAWVRDTAGRVPLLGVCYGHQLIAHALGGKVDWMAGGPEYGTVEAALQPAARTDPLLAELPDRFLVQAAHHQSVARLPSEAVLLADGATGVHAARFMPMTWGVQFHPEYDETISIALLEYVRDDLGKHGYDVDGAIAAVRPSPVALRVLTRFAALCGFEPAIAMADGET